MLLPCYEWVSLTVQDIAWFFNHLKILLALNIVRLLHPTQTFPWSKKHLIKYLLDCLVQWDNIIICYIITLYKGRQIHWHQVWSLRHMTYLPRSRQWAPKCSQKMPWWQLHWLVWNCESSTKTMGFIQGHASHLPAIVSKERVTKIKRPIFRWGTQDHLQTWNIWVETLYNIWI